MFSCVVYGCDNNSITSDSSIEYYPFPKNELAQQWAEACGWQNSILNLDAAHICSVHFDSSAYEPRVEMVDFVAVCSRTLKQEAVPTLYLPQTEIIIKESPLELGNGNSVVVYTINSTNATDGITAISLEDDTGEKQIFEIDSSTANVVKPVTEILVDASDRAEKYKDIKCYPDLFLLQTHNKCLKRDMELLEQEIHKLERQLQAKEDEYVKYCEQHKVLRTQVAKQNTFSQDEQKSLLSKVFSQAQIKILFGKKKIYWTNDDMAVGYTIKHLSNKRCYTYLTKNLGIPLPGISSVKSWITKKTTKRIRS